MYRPRTRGILVLTVVAVLLCLSACGGGGSSSPGNQSGTDTVSLTVTGNTTTTYNKTLAGSTYDPDIIGTLKPGNTPSVVLYADYRTTPVPQYLITFSMEVSSATVTTLNVGVLDIHYQVSNVGNFISTGATGTVTYTRIDNAVGGRIQGSFSNVDMWDSVQSKGMTVSGSFDARIGSIQ